MVLETGQIISNRYEIIERIGSGGMSLVYRARDTKLNRIVSFKVLRQEHLTDKEFTERFRIEARAVASLSHPNIVNVYDVGTEEDINYIVMEYIDGLTLKELILKRAPFANEEILGVAVQITDALMHAHESGVIHRDIKPQNILVTTSGNIKVTDFGIARTVDTNTVAGDNTTMGSVHYFSPEQARGSFIDAKSDLYSLGIVMYEMATGELPFDGDAPISIALKHINEPLPDMFELNPDISQDVEEIILRLTDKKSFNRYSSDKELSDVLKSAIVRETDSRPGSEQTEKRSGMLSMPDEPYERKNKSADKSSVNIDDDVIDKATERKVIIAAVATAFIVIICLAFALWPDAKPKEPEYIEMPDLLGMQFEEAFDLMADMGIVLVKNAENYAPGFSEGEIYEQNYKEGDKLPKGVTLADDKQLKVNVSLGEEKLFEVPDLTKKEAVKAVTMLLDLPFDYVQEDIYDEDTPKDVVVRQEPEAGEKVPQGTEIKIYVSRGKKLEKVTVPNIEGFSEDAAKLKLESAKLIAGSISYRYSDRYEKGQVMTQVPKAGNEVEEGAIVEFAVSRGKEPTTAPATETPETPNSAENNTDPADGDEITEQPPEQNGSQNGDEKTSMIHVPSFNVPDGVNISTVNVMITRTTMDGSTTVAYNKDVPVDSLPMDVPITGSGQQMISVMLNGTEVSNGMEDFDN